MIRRLLLLTSVYTVIISGGVVRATPHFFNFPSTATTTTATATTTATSTTSSSCRHQGPLPAVPPLRGGVQVHTPWHKVNQKCLTFTLHLHRQPCIIQ